MFRTSEGWISQYKEKGALWIHDGNPKRPHALLTSGRHSGGFFNSRLIIPDEVLLYEAASDLIELFLEQERKLWLVEVVVGPQTGATQLAELISERIGVYARSQCFFVSPIKGEGEGKKFTVNDGERKFLFHSCVLLCDDVLTTAGSVESVTALVDEADGYVLPFVLVLVNRSGLMAVNGKRIIALIDHPMPQWPAEECPLCKLGSEAIRPKDPAEWARLNAEY